MSRHARIRLAGVALVVAGAVLLVLAGRAAAHAPYRVVAGLPASVLEHRLVRNLAHSRGAVRWLERARPLTGRELRVLRWHRAAADRQARLLDRLRARQLERMTWLQAVALVDRHLGHGAWLRSCSRPTSEGGWGRWYWNGGYLVAEPTRRLALRGRVTPGKPAGSSGAGGWLQFLRSTFDGVIGPAVRRARHARLHVPPLARSWWHPLGQAVAAVEMLETGRRGEWHGWAC